METIDDETVEVDLMESWRGIFAIPVTPFTPDLAVDEPSFLSQIRFCLDAGVDGFVFPGVASEFYTLSDTERMSLIEAGIGEVNGQVPFVAGVSAASTPQAATLAARSALVGASGIMAMTPYVKHFFEPDTDFLVHHFLSLEQAARGLPIILQNARIGHTATLAQLSHILSATPSIRYLKQETSPTTHAVTAAVAAFGDRLDGVFGGIGGVHMLDELARGAIGTMPTPTIVDEVVAVYQKQVAGDLEGARAMAARLAPCFTYELLYNISWFKEVLKQRGVIAHTVCRVPMPTFGASESEAVSRLLGSLGIEHTNRG